jgi:hypothetical protein
MHETTTFALRVAQGPLFRFAFALAMLSLLRFALLGLSGLVASYVTDRDRAVFWRKVRQRVLWWVLPTVVINQLRPYRSRALYAYDIGLCGISLLFRVLVVVLPTFMVAHVYLWERALAVSWPAFPGRLADVLSVITVVSGLVLFLGRIYSPALREIEPPWSFFKPLLLLVPFFTGLFARHPTWSPVDFQVVLLVHVLSAAAVLALLPFARLLSCMHTRVTTLVPSAAWRSEPAPLASLETAGMRS